MKDLHFRYIIVNNFRWYYRVGATPDPKLVFGAEMFMGLAWWWFLWHLWTEPEHLTVSLSTNELKVIIEVCLNIVV